MSAPTLTGTAFITGAASGIGRAIALAFASAGVSALILIDLNYTGLTETLNLCQRSHLEIALQTVDCTSEDAVNASVAEAVTIFGRIDYAVNCAGLVQSTITPFGSTSTADYDRTNNINARGMFFCMRAQIAAMLKQEPIEVRPGLMQRGVIVNVASAASVVAIPGLSPYIGSKHAAVGLTRCAAADHATDLIRINAVSPGYIDGPLNDRLTEGAPEIKDGMAAAALVKRMGRMEEVADVVVFLAGKGASFMIGQNVVIDGGVSVV